MEGMGLAKSAFALLLALVPAAAQVVPDWYVLELAEPATGRARGLPPIRESQAGVRAQLAARFGARAQVRHATEVVMNSLIVRAQASAAELSALPGVRRVWPVYEVHPELDRVADLHRLREVWEQVGGTDRAGEGVKIGILDTGLDLTHPAFRNDAMAPPEGFPKASDDETRAKLHGKVIVYRNYEALMDFPETSEDRSGHGTAVAMAAAGLRMATPRGEIQGVAPGAWLGVYKIFGGPAGRNSNTAVTLKALDDAAADGMDVLNLSFGFLPQIHPDHDPLLPAVERAASLGVTLIKSHGNSGPGRTTGSTPNLGTNGLAVGSSWSDRFFAAGIRLNNAAPLVAVPGDGPPPQGPIEAPLLDVASVDPTGLACQPLPSGAFSGAALLILRGECPFETKINHAQQAGAVAAVIYTHSGSPRPGIMGTGSASLPAVMIGFDDGVAVKTLLAEQPESRAEIAFDASMAFWVDSNGISGFSSRGPGPDGAIRPDLVAVGEDVGTAAQATNPAGELYGPGGFTVTSGTSFSAPVVAGAYALLKSARPGLEPADYRSLLVNTADPFPYDSPASVQNSGAGRLEMPAAMAGRLTMNPVSVSFGFGERNINSVRTVRLRNTGPNVDTWSVRIDSPGGAIPEVEPAEFSLGPGDTVDLRLTLRAELEPGEHQGFLNFHRIDGHEGERPQRLAYWYGVPTGRPEFGRFLPTPPTSGAPSATTTVGFLLTDAIGAPSTETPVVSVLEGGGTVARTIADNAFYPGYWLIELRLGATSGETNRFRVEAGDLVREITIRTR
jgi:minor extracellular serine protease Vpr